MTGDRRRNKFIKNEEEERKEKKGRRGGSECNKFVYRAGI